MISKLSQADNLLNRLFIADYNDAYISYANFWKGEIAYRINTYDSAVYYLQAYLKNPSTYGEVSVVHAHYTLGYAYMRQEDYDDALKNFQQVTTSINNNSSALQADAYLREADCYFMQKQLSKALQCMKLLSITSCLLLIMPCIKKQLLPALMTSLHKRFRCFNQYKTVILLHH